MTSATDPASSGTTLPAIWNVPFQRSPLFVGRQQLLASLHRTLASTTERSAHVQAIYGVGGVGKTQFAVEYAYRFSRDYDIVWWLRAETPAGLAESYAALARKLGAQLPDDASLQAACDAAKALLERRSRWLLIFDNATGPEPIARYLPASGAGHVLITTRQPQWPQGMAQTVWLKELERGESVQFLRERTSSGVGETAAAEQLAKAVGDLPLALAQAAACIEHGHSTLSNYLRSFEAYWTELLVSGKPGGDYPDSVAMTLELAIRQVEKSALVSAELLDLCAFLSPDDIPFSLLSGRPDLLREPLAGIVANPLELEDAVAPLRQYALAETTGESLCVHRLVAVLARDRMDVESRKAWTELALRLVAGSFRFDTQDLRTWPSCGALLPHALTVAAHADQQRIVLASAADLLDVAGRYLLRRGQLLEAKETFERAMRMATDVCGRQHPRIATLSNNLARTLTRLGHRDAAIPLFEQALDIDQQTYGQTDPHLAAVVNNYGKALHASGDVVTARKQFEWALQVYQGHYGDEHPKVAAVTNNLGYVLMHLGDCEGAKLHLERALAVAERTCGMSHPTVASILYNLATLARASGNRAAAREYLDRALNIDQSAYGPTHPDVARDAQSMGQLLKDLGEVDAAKSHLDMAISIMKQMEPAPAATEPSEAAERHTKPPVESRPAAEGKASTESKPAAAGDSAPAIGFADEKKPTAGTDKSVFDLA